LFPKPRLGHEQERTAHIYLHADLAIKQRALDRVTPPNGRRATGHRTACSPSCKTSDAIMPTSIATNTGSCGEFRLAVGMTARSA